MRIGSGRALGCSLGVILAACGGARPLLPPPPEPAAGFWFDDFRRARERLREPEPLAGAARVRITPPDGPLHGVLIAGHGFNKRARGRLDDLWARAIYLDSGPEALVLVSLDVIGLSLPRVERIRARVTRLFPGSILVVSTHNHAGPDTLGLWGPAAFGVLPVRSGMDPAYMEWLEARAARAIRLAVARARPARAFAGRFELPAGLAENLREPEDVPRIAQVLRLADARSASTIATLVHWGCHAESLQDWNQLLSADFPGVLYAELEEALGGVGLYVSGPAGGMIEPASGPRDPEQERLRLRAALGGALARGAILQTIAGMQELPLAELRVRNARLSLEVQVGGLLDLAFGLGLPDPRPLTDDRLVSEVAFVSIGPLRLLTLPGEPTPELGRAFERLLGGEYRWVVGLGQDELGYLLSERQWADPRFGYERDMSLGPGAAGQLRGAVLGLIQAD